MPLPSSSPPASSERVKTFYHPQLTPQFCFDTSALKEFLRLSRSTIDDSITQNINALYKPSRPVFNHSTTTERSVAYPKHLILAQSCSDFVNNVLFTSWQNRSDVLNYCASVATSNDPNDPESLTRLAENEAARERVIDERLDPYSARWFPKESRTQILAGVVRNERMIEEIIRERAWKVIQERCEDAEWAQWGKDWKEALGQWRQLRAAEKK